MSIDPEGMEALKENVRSGLMLGFAIGQKIALTIKECAEDPDKYEPGLISKMWSDVEAIDEVIEAAKESVSA
ncbi:hypothetical protein [Roseibium aggregatum]|uniref:Uncharacterized protein n=1 Tax=Roseibium aggregatum TaxID=187304 RepID=A0A0M6YA67_9HYPH|nr:hypothetical protein [Roseibium aggregatum]CTQ45700.1 hypothetical protein LAL4801_04155 [Roseibium aggregatum]